MLCRTANDLYWTARHIERAENTARMVDLTQRIAMLPERLDRGRSDAASWRQVLDALELSDEFARNGNPITAVNVLRFLCLDPDNPSSIFACLRAARESARAQRGAITAEMYEDLNASWLGIRGNRWEQVENDGLPRFIDWVKRRSASFRGVTVGTMWRDEGYNFLRLGTFIERADCTTRVLSLKFGEERMDAAGTTRSVVDYYQWSALLQATSTFETYRRIYKDALAPERVAELMILREDTPRSLATCSASLFVILERIAGDPKAEVVRQAGALAAETRFGRIDAIMAEGMRAYLARFMTRSEALAAEIDRHFMLTAG